MHVRDTYRPELGEGVGRGVWVVREGEQVATYRGRPESQVGQHYPE